MCSYETLPKYCSYRVNNTAPRTGILCVEHYVIFIDLHLHDVIDVGILLLSYVGPSYLLVQRLAVAYNVNESEAQRNIIYRPAEHRTNTRLAELLASHKSSSQVKSQVI